MGSLMTDPLHDSDDEIIELTDIVELGSKAACAAEAVPPAEEGQAAPEAADDHGRDPAADQPVSDACDEQAAASEPDADGPSGNAEGDPSDAAAHANAVMKLQAEEGDAAMSAEALDIHVASADEQSQASLEQRLAIAEKTIMALCAEVSKLRQRAALSDYPSEVFFIHASNPSGQEDPLRRRNLIEEHSSASLEEAVTRVEKLESRIDGLEQSSMRSAAEAAAKIIREEIAKITQGT